MASQAVVDALSVGKDILAPTRRMTGVQGAPVTEYFPILAQGWQPQAPPGSLKPSAGQGIWRNLVNMRAHDGLLQRRAGLVPLGGTTTQPSDQGFQTAGDIEHDGEIPLWIYTAISTSTDVPATVGTACGNEFQAQGGAEIVIVITNRQAWLSRDGMATWSNICPTYTTGTVAVTNGSPTVTGSGTLWATYRISPFQYISLPGGIFQICSVNSDTSITLTANYTGSTTGSTTYAIRRTWAGGTTLHQEDMLFAQVFNQTLYIAGTYLGAADGSVAPAVIKCVNILSGIFFSSYITGDRLYGPGVDFISGLNDIVGLQLTQDGRVWIAGTESWVYASSELSDTVWNTQPAYAAYITLKPGAIHAMGKISNMLTLHFEDGIVLGYPQPTDAPPISWQPSMAEVGCVAPRTLRCDQGVERFVGISGGIYQFNLWNTTSIDLPVRGIFSGMHRSDLRSHLHATFDDFRREYVIFQEARPITIAYRFALEHQQWFKDVYPFPIGAVSERDDRSLARSDSQAVVGIANLDIQSGATGPMLWGLSEAASTDAPASFQNATTPGCVMETDDLDWEEPLIYKAMQRAIVAFRGYGPITETVICGVSGDGGATFYEVSEAVTYSTTQEIMVQFSFPLYFGDSGLVNLPGQYAPARARLRCRLRNSVDGTFSGIPVRMWLIGEISGSLEDVEL